MISPYLAEYFRSWLPAPGGPRPVFVTFFVTAACNARCGHCFYRPEVRTGGDPELTAEEVDRIARGMPAFFKLLISGGEPFLRHDLDRLCASFVRHCGVRRVTVPTNGLLPDRIEPAVRALCADGRTEIEIALSIDGLGGLHDEIRGVPGAFDRLRETYDRLSATSRDLPNLILRFNLTFSRPNQDAAIPVFEYVTETLGCPNVDMVLTRGNPFEPSWKEFDPAKYRLAAEWLIHHRRQKPGRFGGLFALKTRAEKTVIADRAEGRGVALTCSAGSRIAVIRENGDVFPCELKEESFGNLREAEYRFGAVWRSERAAAFRRTLARDGCACTFETAVSTALAYSPLRAAGVLLSRRRRDRPKRP